VCPRKSVFVLLRCISDLHKAATEQHDFSQQRLVIQESYYAPRSKHVYMLQIRVKKHRQFMTQCSVVFVMQLLLQQSEYTSVKTKADAVSKFATDAFGNVLTCLNYTSTSLNSYSGLVLKITPVNVSFISDLQANFRFSKSSVLSSCD